MTYIGHHMTILVHRLLSPSYVLYTSFLSPLTYFVKFCQKYLVSQKLIIFRLRHILPSYIMYNMYQLYRVIWCYMICNMYC